MTIFPDIRRGKHSLSQHIELRKIFKNNELSDIERFEAIVGCLAGVTPRPERYSVYIEDYKETCEAFAHWVRMEDRLRLTTTADEVAAGAAKYSRAVGDIGLVVDLAREFGQRPDEVLLRWTWAEVFSVLMVRKERTEYERRYNEVISRKWRQSR